MAESIWPTIHAERRALADDLAELTPQQWQTPSLSAAWSVHDVLAHLVAAAKMTPLKLIPGLAGAGFDFHKYMARLVALEGAAGPQATLATFRTVELSETSPPAPATTWLGEAFVHGEDIRRPLGIAHSYPLPELTRVITYYSKLNALPGAKRRIANLTLQASDTDFRLGSGPVVEGRAISLVMGHRRPKVGPGRAFRPRRAGAAGTSVTSG